MQSCDASRSMRSSDGAVHKLHQRSLLRWLYSLSDISRFQPWNHLFQKTVVWEAYSPLPTIIIRLFVPMFHRDQNSRDAFSILGGSTLHMMRYINAPVGASLHLTPKARTAVSQTPLAISVSARWCEREADGFYPDLLSTLCDKRFPNVFSSHLRHLRIIKCSRWSANFPRRKNLQRHECI